MINISANFSKILCFLIVGVFLMVFVDIVGFAENDNNDISSEQEYKAYDENGNVTESENSVEYKKFWNYKWILMSIFMILVILYMYIAAVETYK